MRWEFGSANWCERFVAPTRLRFWKDRCLATMCTCCLSCPPNLSPSKIMQYIKGKSSRKLLMEFKHLQKAFLGRHLWARGYFVASSGNVTDEVIQEYIRQQDGTEPDDGGDNFRITKS